MFFITTIISFLYLICSILININWINDISCYFGYILAIFLVVFVAIIPGFIFLFMFISLLWKKCEKNKPIKDEDVTILIPVYNSKKTIKDTLMSIEKQIYNANIYVYIIDDGSTDKTLDFLKTLKLDCNIKILKSSHMGKSFALNKGLKYVKTNYFITIDSDTVLNQYAVRNIMTKLINSNKKVVATAGCVFVKNAKKNFITKLQEWDYTLGIFGVKLYQGNYNSTLVTQGAFSAYKTNVVKEIGGWKNCVGEDIVLTWKLLSCGYETNFAQNAISYTLVPQKFQHLEQQRKRWQEG